MRRTKIIVCAVWLAAIGLFFRTANPTSLLFASAAHGIDDLYSGV